MYAKHNNSGIFTPIFLNISKTITHKMCVSFSSTAFVQNILHPNKGSVSKKQVILHVEKHVGLHRKCPLLLSDFDTNFNALTKLSKILQYKIPWKSI